MARSVLRESSNGGYKLVCDPENEAAIYAEALTLNLWPHASEFAGPVKLIGCDPNMKSAAGTKCKIAGRSNKAVRAQLGNERRRLRVIV